MKSHFLGEIWLLHQLYAFSGGLSENECKYLNKRDHKIYTVKKVVGYRVIFFPACKVVPGAYSDQRGPAGPTWNPEKVVFLPIILGTGACDFDYESLFQSD